MLGLTDKQVRRQIDAGLVEGSQKTITKSISKIIQENIFTLFNFLNLLIACLLFYAGAYSNMFFIFIILLNIAIGIYQQIKAKKLIDSLSILNRPIVHVVRNGKEIEILKEEVVKEDVLVLRSGMQVSNDSKVISGEVEMNESLLTGESDAVPKNIGDQLYSGSFVISGKAYAQVIHVGNENYTSGLINQVRSTKLVESEFLTSMRKVTRFTTCFIIPLGILLMAEALYFQNVSVSQAIVNTSAALLGMLPKGLVLLMSVSLANGVISLSEKKILIQNPYALETMAHVDTLCLDKTGTITTGKLKVKEVYPLCSFDKEKVISLIRSYIHASDDTNATITALKQYFHAEKIYPAIHKIPFSSERKWSAISFQNAGTLFVGAPEKFMDVLPACIQDRLDRGEREIVIAYISTVWKDREHLPEDLVYLYGISLEDQLRPHALETIRYLQKDGMNLKLISGDHAKTACIVAEKAGFSDISVIDLSSFEQQIDYDQIAGRYSIFARVTPKQKQKLIQALKRQGHKIAMCGDGVNDLLAMKEADCAIAIAQGSEASKQLAEIVLLDSDFTNLPEVIEEGRRTVNHVTRCAGVFFIKTIYSLLITVVSILMNVPFPFIPLQITLVDAFIEAYPSFLTIKESDTSKINGDFLHTVLERAFPFALTIAIAIICIQLAHPFVSQQNQTLMYLSLIIISILSVIKSCVPFDRFRAFICVTMSSGIFGALLFLPALFHVVPVTFSMMIYLILSILCIGLLVVVSFKSFALIKKYPGHKVHSWQS